ncbi:MAG TPA: hypothetical protein VFB14_26405 [Bryobacteraceae bacterium]|nr:hypothetical protein [Bryobacteraceae bacterium]
MAERAQTYTGEGQVRGDADAATNHVDSLIDDNDLRTGNAGLSRPRASGRPKQHDARLRTRGLRGPKLPDRPVQTHGSHATR